MSKFVRDEKKTYPFVWLTIGGLFAGTAVWAVYAELVTRVPWQKHQDAFFDMEYEQSKQGLDRAKQEWEKEIEPTLKDKLARKKELEDSKASGAYKQAKDELARLTAEYAAAEQDKTFASSDLDEAYYYRNLAEYDRDAVATAARKAFLSVPQANVSDVNKSVDAIYADPPLPARTNETEAMFHLVSEVSRMKAHIEQIDKAMASAPAEAKKALEASRRTEKDVLDKIEVEIKHQKKVDDAVRRMVEKDGPTEPQLTEKDPVKRLAQQKQLREEVCKGHEHTRNCITWLQLEPVDTELKALDVEIQKRRRRLLDSELRFGTADERANPKFNPENLIKTLVGPFQIQQVVTHWIEFDREVDMEQVDRCQTCHMGIDNSNYTAASIPSQFRTHPRRETLLAAHPVESFGCTSCHQGQGRATDNLAHSGWALVEKHGQERWHFEGDHYWEDPLLPVGKLSRVVIDEANDEFAVKMPGIKKWEDGSIKIDQAEYKTEEELLGQIQNKLAELVKKNESLSAKWHAVVRKLDNRIQIGVEQNDPAEFVPRKEIPAFSVKFTDQELSTVLGFEGVSEVVGKTPWVIAAAPPSVPIRSDGMASTDTDGRYHPPQGELGLQIPDEMRNRFVQALPEVESGCMKCHQSDVDLVPRASRAKHTASKLQYERAEALRKSNPDIYRKLNDGSDNLPAVAVSPTDVSNPVPTLAEGRHLFKKLNCVGCHILDGFSWDRNSGPSLDNVSAKVSPEWMLTWIRNPRGWRAKTRMPNLWPKPLDPASKRPVPPESPEYAKWQKQMREETVAIASFLVDRSENPSSRPGASKDAQALRGQVTGYADVAGATAEKGKVIFEAYGCQGCHARSDKDTASEKLPEPWRSRERDVAPTLSNMASKTTADWVAYWVENPSRYWHGTKMPNLRLSRLEAASVGKYVTSLKEAPLHPEHVDAADIALVSDATKRAERVPCANAGGKLLTRVECGEKLIGYYGCFGCHQIGGFENYAPVAPELGGFAKKDITTLDFGYALADHHLQTTETFATLKLDSPRIYRRDRIELKMADFDLSPREIRSLVVFLKSLVNAKPKNAYKPSEHPAYAAALEGRQIVDDYNCRACHVVEENGAEIDALRLSQLTADPQARAPFLGGEGKRVQPEWLFSFLRDPGKKGIRPWLHPEWAWGDEVPDDKLALRMPTFNFTPEQVTALVRYFASWDGQEYPYQAVQAHAQSEEQKLYALTHMNASDAANCLSCHYQGEFPIERGKTELTKMAPNLNEVARRLRPEWVKEWLLRPQNYLPYTKMTAFWATTDREKDNPFWPSEADPFRSTPLDWKKVAGFDQYSVEQQVEAVRDFLFNLPPDAVFPKPGEEADSPLVKKQPAPPAADKGADKGAAKDVKQGKKTGKANSPAHM